MSEQLWSKKSSSDDLYSFRSSVTFPYFHSIASLGKSELILEKFSGCSLEKCSPIGLESRDYPARGTFSVGTDASSPYCRKFINIVAISQFHTCIDSFHVKQNNALVAENDPKITKKMRELRQLQLEREKSG